MVSVFRAEMWSCWIVNLVGDETSSCVQSVLLWWPCWGLTRVWLTASVYTWVEWSQMWLKLYPGGTVDVRLPPWVTVCAVSNFLLLSLQYSLMILECCCHSSLAAYAHLLAYWLQHLGMSCQRTFSSILDDYWFFVSLISSLNQNTVLYFPLFRVVFFYSFP